MNTSVSISSSVIYKLNFKYPGEAGPQLVLMVIYLVNNGGYTEHPFSVASGGININTEFSVVNDS